MDLAHKKARNLTKNQTFSSSEDGISAFGICLYGIITVYLCRNNRPTQKHAGQTKISNENNTN